MTPAPTPSHRAERALTAVFAAALALYLPTVRHGFVFDDDVVVVRNPLIRSLATLPALVSGTEWSGAGYEYRVYRPLTSLSYAANHAISGLSPWSYHLANALLHAGAAALVLALALRLGLGKGAAVVAALTFAVHPIHVEAVSNVVGRKEVLATVFLLAMLLAHLRARAGGAFWSGLAVLAYAGAMLSKEIGVAGVALAAALDLTHPDPRAREGRRARLALHLGYAAALALFLAAFRAVTAEVPGRLPTFADNPAAHAPQLVRVMTAIAVFGKGIGLQLLPLGQSPDYSYAAITPVASPLDPRFLSGLAIGVGWAAAAVALRRRAPLVLFAFVWYVATLLPGSNLLFPIGTIFGERLLYLPSVALALLAASGAAALARRVGLRPVAAAAALAVIALSAATLRYSAAWASEERLFLAAAQSQPASSKVHHKLAWILADRDPAAALAAVERSLAIWEEDPKAHLVRAAILRRLGRAREEEDAVHRALALAPGSAEARYAMGRVARDGGRLDEAAGWWGRALEANARHAPALADLATLALVRGDAAAALDLASRAVDADPSQASAWYNLGLLRRARGDAAGSRAAFERFVAVAGPEYAAEVAAVRDALRRLDR